MSTDVNSITGQSETIYTKLSEFFSQAKNSVQNGGEFPSLSNILSSMEYSELLRLVRTTSSYSASYIGGSAVETIHLAASMQREYGMRVKNKSEYYLDGISDHTTESEYYNTLKYHHTQLLGGGGVNGSLTQ